MSTLDSILSQNQKLQVCVSKDLVLQVKAPTGFAWLDVMVGRADRFLHCHLAHPGRQVGDENTSDLMTIMQLLCDTKGQDFSSSARGGIPTANQIGRDDEHVHGLVPPQTESMEQARAPKVCTSRPSWLLGDELCFAVSCEHKLFGHLGVSSKPRTVTMMAYSDKVCMQATTLGDDADENSECGQACAVCCVCLCCVAALAAVVVTGGAAASLMPFGISRTQVQVKLQACGPWTDVLDNNPAVPLSRQITSNLTWQVWTLLEKRHYSL
eukprot:TRINITY_DN27847_c0_g2_i1.p1 TRINITY_DN27847_c0_g2~~TRINITY_DN27847_c0_g2_i1.p1  ORF type:complete len:289 (-),score=35.34 TRINITY_DN27847_c0_g2_i1:242-1045(-)